MNDVCMCNLCRERAEAYCRVAAFGAIRRAVVYARGDEIDAKIMKAQGHPGWIEAQWRADEVRQIIRAAIGSDK